MRLGGGMPAREEGLAAPRSLNAEGLQDGAPFCILRGAPAWAPAA